jgi:hypothetical protein
VDSTAPVIQQDAAPYYRGEIRNDIAALRTTIKSAIDNVPFVHLSNMVHSLKLLDVVEEMVNKAVGT